MNVTMITLHQTQLHIIASLFFLSSLHRRVCLINPREALLGELGDRWVSGEYLS